MAAWIVLLRGINVGGRNALPMKELVRDLKSLGLEDVRTYIQSGNAVFRSARKISNKLHTRIATTIEHRHGFRPQVLILSADELRQAVESNPFPEAEDEPKTLHLFFLASTPSAPDIELLTQAKSPAERFHLTNRVLYLHAPEGIGRSKLVAKIENALGVAVTARNWRTVLKLIDMARTR